ncbi:MAG: transposase [Gammaproteobacteria bacterium]
MSTPQGGVNVQGFSLHAEVRLAINQRHKLEHLCRYITRPALANEHLGLHRAGQSLPPRRRGWCSG